MCWGSTFCCCFSLASGSIIMSTFMCTLGLLGVLLLPFMPYSNRADEFDLIYAYTILLMLGFGLALLGACLKSWIPVCLGLLVGLVCFIAWLYLVHGSFSSFNDWYYSKSDKVETKNCIGLRCPESHWLVPREIVKLVEIPSEYSQEPQRVKVPEPADLPPDPSNQKMGDIEAINNIEDRIDYVITNEPNETRRNFLKIDNIEQILDSPSFQKEPPRNLTESINNIEGILDALPTKPNRSEEESIANIESKLDALMNNPKKNLSESMKTIERKIISLLPAMEENPADIPKIINVQNYYDIYRMKMTSRQRRRVPSAGSYLNAAYSLKKVQEIMTALAVIYGILFLCALLTLLKYALLLIRGGELKVLCCCEEPKSQSCYAEDSCMNSSISADMGCSMDMDSFGSNDSSYRDAGQIRQRFH